jgi:hypothetical protein
MVLETQGLTGSAVRLHEWCKDMSHRARQAALADFSESTFLRKMKAVIISET